ncbi:MAG: hypothetical protein KDD92_15370 [Caldilineaceae bacterium]|nr:hypothetical protein [Caldilineaceae bacterium]
MAKDRSLVRAGDLGAWQFCHRSWWLANVEKIPHERPEVFDRGNAAHAAHGRSVRRMGDLRTAAFILIGCALLLLLLAFLLQAW